MLPRGKHTFQQSLYACVRDRCGDYVGTAFASLPYITIPIKEMKTKENHYALKPGTKWK
jgi:hypothetical protein